MNNTITVTTTNTSYSNEFSAFLAGTTISFLFVVVLVFAVVLAIAVNRDAKRRMIESGQLFLLSPGIWSALVLFTGGYLGALAYWLIHYSSLRNTNEKMHQVIAFPTAPGDIDQPAAIND
jgi:ABC-type amino acid transport system permease subunit